MFNQKEYMKEYHQKNKERDRAKRNQWKKDNKDKMAAMAKKYYHTLDFSIIRAWTLKSYGLTVDQYNLMFENQKGLCAICEQPETRMRKGTKYHLAVDHDHETGKVRGLLCRTCNTAIGLLNDNKELLQKAINYLKEKQ